MSRCRSVYRPVLIDKLAAVLDGPGDQGEATAAPTVTRNGVSAKPHRPAGDLFGDC